MLIDGQTSSDVVDIANPSVIPGMQTCSAEFHEEKSRYGSAWHKWKIIIIKVIPKHCLIVFLIFYMIINLPGHQLWCLWSASGEMVCGDRCTAGRLFGVCW